jgi:rieske iron-sulfur protein
MSETSTPDATADPLASRRRLLKWLIRIGLGAFALAFVLPALALKTLQQQKDEVAAGDVLVYATGDLAGQPLLPDQLQPGQGVQLFPQNKTTNQDNLIELVRLSAGTGVDGLVAYSAICTHLGCSVIAMLNSDGHIACPCHGSQFDPANGAAVVHGPAGRPLPSLPIALDPSGSVMANGGFSGPVGPQ